MEEDKNYLRNHSSDYWKVPEKVYRDHLSKWYKPEKVSWVNFSLREQV